MEGAATVTIATLLSSIGDVIFLGYRLGWYGRFYHRQHADSAAVLRNSACRSWRRSVQAAAERLTVSRWGAILPRTSPFLY